MNWGKLGNSWRLLLLLLPIPLFWIVLSEWDELDGVYYPLRNLAKDWRDQIRGPLEVPEVKIAYVNVDAKSITELLKERPWARHIFAQSAEMLIKHGKAKTVGFDLLFTPLSASGLVSEELLHDSERIFGEVIGDYPDQIVLAANYTNITLPLDLEQRLLDSNTVEIKRNRSQFPLLYDSSSPLPKNTFPEMPSFPIIKPSMEIAGKIIPQVGRVGLISEDTTISKGAVPRWVPLFAESAGPYYALHFLDGYIDYYNLNTTPDEEDYFLVDDHLQVFLDNDEGYKKIYATPMNQEKMFYHFIIEIALQYYGLTHDAVEITDDFLTIRDPEGIEKIKIPLSRKQLMEVNWFTEFPVLYSEEERETKVIYDVSESISTVYQNGLNLKEGSEERKQAALEYFERFEDAIVLIGPVDRTLQDLAPTPLDDFSVPKVGMHGNALKTIFSGVYIKRLSSFWNILLVLGLTLIVVIPVIATGRFSSLFKVFGVLVFLGYIAFVFLAYSWWHLVVPLVAPVGSAFTTAMLGTVFQLIIEEKQKGRIKGMFGTYLSPDLVNDMIESGDEPSLGGEDSTITAFFSDVQSFSAFSELLEPTQLVDLMNEYLTAMTDILMEEGSYVDKYIGDAIVAMFNAPVHIEHHALKGCIAAVRMQQCQLQLRDKWASEGDKWPSIVSKMQTRIGLNTGHATVGNMGSENRFNYTMMGDTVNLAARSESGAKAYGVYIMVADRTREEAETAGDDVVFRYLDKIIVKGRSQPVSMHEVVCLKADLPEETAQCLALFAEGIEQYQAQCWAEAKALFEKSSECEPNQPGKTPGVVDNPSTIMIKRCEYYAKEPPPAGADWDGVWVMQSK